MLATRVLLFAMYRELLGKHEVNIHLPDGASVEDVFSTLAADHPELNALRPFTRFAVNRTMVDPAMRLRDGDEIAFLQPVSGGSD